MFALPFLSLSLILQDSEIMTPEKKTLKYSISRYFITGILTIIPIWLGVVA